MGRITITLLLLLGWLVTPASAVIPPLPVDILSPTGEMVGKAMIYSNYVEIFDGTDRRRGAIGIVQVEGLAQLWLLRADGERTLVGTAQNHRMFDNAGKLIGFFQWTPIWSYVYDKSVKKMGKAQCLAYQGVCAAGVAGYLLGLY